jgi:hypothetical protein
VGPAASSIPTLGTDGGLQLHNLANASGAQLSIVKFNTDTGAGTLVLGKSKSATVAAGAVVANNDSLGTISFVGDDGTDLGSSGAQITCLVDGTPGANDMPGRLTFSTTADGNASPTERMRITSAGLVGIGTSGVGLIQADGASSRLAFATNSTERLRIDSSGRLLVGTSSAVSVNGLTARLELHSQQTTDGASASIARLGNDGAPGPQLNFGKSRSGALSPGGIVQNNDYLGEISFCGDDGTDINSSGAKIMCQVDGTPGANDMPGRLVFYATPSGSSSPIETMRLRGNGFVSALGVYSNTTAVAANVNVDSNGLMRRSTSSVKYKTDIETLQDSYADALLSCRPVWYRSTCENDNPSWGWWGFIAEEVAAIDPRLVQWKTVKVTYDENGSAVETPCNPEPEGVAYDRFVPHLLNLIKRQQQAIETLEAGNTDLLARVSALESA